MLAAPTMAQAGCVKKAAEATASTKSSAKWFVMETIVQQVGWEYWPGWLANGKIAGHRVKRKHYKCKKGGWGYTCYGQATICTK